MTTTLLHSSNAATTKPALYFLRYFIFLAVMAFTANTNAQVATNYIFSEQGDGPFVPLQSDIKTRLFPTPPAAEGAWNNDAIVTTAIGFSFTFNGASYANINVSPNGFISFGATLPSTTNYIPISTPTVAGYSGAISGFGQNIGIATRVADATYPAYQANSVSKLLVGSSPNQILKIEYRGFRRNVGASDQVMSMQIWLYEGSNLIEIHYDEVLTNFGSDTSTNAQIGLRGSTNTDYNNRVTTSGDWPTLPATTAAGTGAGVTVKTLVGTKIPTGANRLFRWTPVNCTSPSGLTTTNLLSTSVTATWTAPMPAPAGYDWEIRTSGLGGSGPAGLTNSGSVVSPTVTANILGLTASTSYTVYVRSNCGGSGNSVWISSGVFTTLCAALPDPFITPYFQGFDGPTVPGFSPYHSATIPTCTKLQNAGTGNPWVISSANNYTTSGMDQNILMYNGQNPANVNQANAWFFTEGMTLDSSRTYTLMYLYGGVDTPSSITNNLEVGYGMVPQASSMTNLDKHPTIKNSANSNMINFTPPVTGVYFFGFNARSAANNGQMFVDDVQVVASTCKKVTGVTVPPALVSSNSALVAWTAPSPAPSGYLYYLTNTTVAATALVSGTRYMVATVGTSNFAAVGAASNTVGTVFIATGTTTGTGTAVAVPINGTAATNTNASTILNLSSLTAATTYYIWVRSDCSFGGLGEWSAGASFTTNPAPPTYCFPNATGYAQDPNGITNVTMGSINNSTGRENATGFYGDYSGLSTNVSQGATVPVSITFGTGYTYDTNIWVDWNNNGNFSDAGELVYTGASAAPNPSTVSASFAVPGAQPLGSRRLRIGGIDYGPTDTFNPNPFTDPCRVGTYQVFEDYTINVVVAPPALTLSSSATTQCAGTNSPVISLTAGGGTTFDVYSWFPPAGVSGNHLIGYTFSNTATQTYILTATQTSGNYSSNTASYTYTANDVPTPITIASPSGTVYCPSGSAIPLASSGGVVSNITIFSEGFNSGIGSFTQSSTNTGGSSATAANWTSRPSPYTTPGFFGGTTITSNDATPFMFTNSDSQGGTPSPSVTRTLLESPAIDLTGYSAASLTFYQYLNWFDSLDNVQVQICTSPDNVAAYSAWTTLQQYTSDVGTASNFSFTQIPLAPGTQVGKWIKIRFNFYSEWGWWWAIDNFRIAGSAASSIVWTPNLDLYTDAAGTALYNGTDGAATIYARPSVGRTYTATASTPMPTVCTSTATTAVTVTTFSTGTVSANQIACSAAPPSNLTVSSYAGAVTKWQWSPTLSPGTWTDIPASASATLTSAQMGTLTADRFYRAVITSGGCSLNSAVISVIFSSTTWNGGPFWTNGAPDSTKQAIFNTGTFSSSGDIYACSVIINNCAVTINPGDNLVVQNEVIRTGGSLTFESQVLPTPNNGNLVQVNDASVNAGSVTYNRYTTKMRLYDYTYWSSPLSPQTLVGLSPLTLSDKYFEWNPSAGTAGQYSPIASNNLMEKGKGYIIRSPQNFTTTPTNFLGIFNGGSNDGIPNNGVVTYNVRIGTSNLNLLGNPYPCTLDADDFLGDAVNATRISGTIYLWTHNTPISSNQYTGSDYAVYNLGGGAGTSAATNVGTGGAGNNNAPSRYIAAGQGFFVKALVDNQAVTFRNAMREIGNNTNFYRTQQNATPGDIERNRVWLELKNSGGAYKQLMVGYIETATNALDRSFDGDVAEGGNPVSLYSILDNSKLTLQGRALPFDVNDLVPIGFRVTTAGNYEINLSNFDGFFTGDQNVYIEDKMLNTIHDLKSGSYTFTTNPGTFDDRFVLRYTDGTALGNQDPVFSDNSVVVYKTSADVIHISTSGITMQSVKIMDIRGRVIFERKNINNNQAEIANLNIASEVLLVQITSTDNRVITKKIVF
jgi:hypothetical protein